MKLTFVARLFRDRDEGAYGCSEITVYHKKFPSIEEALEGLIEAKEKFKNAPYNVRYDSELRAQLYVKLPHNFLAG